MSIQSEMKLKNCGFVKTVLMVFVVFYHSILFWNGDWFVYEPVYQSNVLCILSKWIGTFHISGFTLVSGYIFGYIFYEKHGYPCFIDFVKRKIKRLIVPYVMVSIIWVVPITSIFFNYSPNIIIEKYVLGISPSHLWFLLMLFNVFMISYGVFSWIKNKVFLSGFISVGLFGASIVGNYFLLNLYQIFTSFQFFSYFTIGVIIRFYRNKIHVKKKALFLCCGVHLILFILYLNLQNMNGMYYSLTRMVVSYVLNCLGAFSAFYLLQLIGNNYINKNKVILYVSKRSMTVFLLHQQFIYIPLYYLNGLIHPYIHSLINFVFSLSVSMLLASVLLKFNITRIMIGEKSGK